MKRGPRTSKARPGNFAAKPEKARPTTDRALIERLSRELAEAQVALTNGGPPGADPSTARKMEALTEAALTARGQALEATLERTKAQGELRALRDAIERATGLTGWLVRRAAKRIK